LRIYSTGVVTETIGHAQREDWEWCIK